MLQVTMYVPPSDSPEEADAGITPLSFVALLFLGMLYWTRVPDLSIILSVTLGRVRMIWLPLFMEGETLLWKHIPCELCKKRWCEIYSHMFTSSLMHIGTVHSIKFPTLPYPI